MGFDLVVAFFVGMIWWEYIVFFFFCGVFGFSLKDNSGIGAVVALGVLAIIPWSGVGSLWATVTLGSFVGTIITFLVIGIFWSIFKWRIFVKDIISEYKQIESQGGGKVTAERVKDRIASRKSNDQIGFWIVMWPLSALGYFINDFIYDLAMNIVTKLTRLYDSISDKLIKSSGIE